MAYLDYLISGFRCRIITPEAERTASLLPSFQPFACAVHPDVTPEVCLKGGENILLPSEKPLYEVELAGWNQFFYKEADHTYVLIQRGEQQYIARYALDGSVVDTNFTLTDKRESYWISRFLSIAMTVRTAPLGNLKVHASVIVKQGKALLFLGVSGTGKSTHASLWLEHVKDCYRLNDDEPFIRLQPDGKFKVYGTPWSGKTHCYINDEAEVAALVHLRQSPDNKLTRLSPMDALNSMLISVATTQGLADIDRYTFSTVTDVIERLPVYRLDCRPDREAVSLTETLLPA